MEKIKIFDLTRQIHTLKNEINRALWATLETGQFILGNQVSRFESEFCEYLGCKHAVGTGSGTGALSLAYQAIGLAPGQRIITTPTTYVATAMAAAINGGIPEFVDIQPGDGQMDLNQLHDRLTKARHQGNIERYRAIVPVHLYGHPENMEQILAISREFDIPIIEDACQAHGACFSLNGKKTMAGTAGHLGCFSFYPTKNLGAYGDGGMVVTNDSNLAGKLKMLRNYGQREEHHRHLLIAGNNRLDEIQAAWLRKKLPHLNDYNRRRHEIATYYTSRFASLPLTLPPEEEKGMYAAYHLYVIQTDERESLRGYLGRHGIETAIHYPTPIHLQPAFRHLGYHEGQFPQAEQFARTVLSLPMYPELTDAEVEYVTSTLKDFF